MNMNENFINDLRELEFKFFIKEIDLETMIGEIVTKIDMIEDENVRGRLIDIIERCYNFSDPEAYQYQIQRIEKDNKIVVYETINRLILQL